MAKKKVKKAKAKKAVKTKAKKNIKKKAVSSSTRLAASRKPKAVSKKTKKVLTKKKSIARKPIAVKKPTEKVLGKIEHYFDKIAVAALSVKSPFKVGDYVHIKGHTTDFVQRIESMQIEHKDVAAVKKGDDVGMKVVQQVRENDVVYLSLDKGKTTVPQKTAVVAEKQVNIQKPLFPSVAGDKPQGKPMPIVKPAPIQAPQAKPIAPKAGDPYGEKKFFNF